MDLTLKPEALTAEWRVLDCRSAEAFARGHMPGAIHADLEEVLSSARQPGFDPASGGRHPLPSPETFTQWLGRQGITPETPVAICDGARGGSGGARAWWMLRALGHQDVALLEGDLDPLFTESGTSRTAMPVPYPSAPWMFPTVPLEQVDHARQDPAWIVLDVRSAPRWRGEVEPIDPVPGQIPGSVNLCWEENLDAQGFLKDAHALRDQYLRLLGDVPPERLIVHCGSGVTACHTLLALEVAGLFGARLYVGSFSEWCRRGMPLNPTPTEG